MLVAGSASSVDFSSSGLQVGPQLRALAIVVLLVKLGREKREAEEPDPEG
jgi:hypothetical protein